MLITFEGIEGCGKSTLAGRLARRLDLLSVPFVLTFQPGGTRVGRGLRKILLDPENTRLCPLAELLLYEADRAQHVEEVIKPALEQGKWVLCDRYFDATTVYQGHARGLDIGFVEYLNEKACSGLQPDLTFLVDCPVDVGIERALKRDAINLTEGQGRFENEERRFHEAVRKAYLVLARMEPKRFVVLDGLLGESELEDAAFEYISGPLKGPEEKTR